MKARLIDLLAGNIFLIGLLGLILCYFIPSLRSIISYFTPIAIILSSWLIIIPLEIMSTELDKKTSHKKIWAEVIETNLAGVKTYYVKVSIKVFGIVFEKYYKKSDTDIPLTYEITEESKVCQYKNFEQAKAFADLIIACRYEMPKKVEVVTKVKAVNTVIYSTAKKQKAKVDPLPLLEEEKYSKEEIRIFMKTLKRGQEENIDDILEELKKVREPVQVKN